VSARSQANTGSPTPDLAVVRSTTLADQQRNVVLRTTAN